MMFRSAASAGHNSTSNKASYDMQYYNSFLLKGASKPSVRLKFSYLIYLWLVFIYDLNKLKP